MKLFWNKTNFKAGGLLGIGADTSVNRLRAPVGWVAPNFIDNRGYCLTPDDQGQTSTCAARSMAGDTEVKRWMRSHFPEQVDAMALYAKAKELDGDGRDGTSLFSVYRAAAQTGVIPATAGCDFLRTIDDVIFAIHAYGTVLLGLNITDGWTFANRDGWVAESSDSMGGHAVLGCYFQKDKSIGFQNSWGVSWGDKGFGRMTTEQFKAQFMGGLAIKW